MAEDIRAVSWEAPEHRHIEKTSDWYWALGIVAVAAAVAAFIFNNILFGMVILLAAATMILVSHRHPKIVPFEVSVRGVRLARDFHPMGTLESYCIDEDNPLGPQLIVKSQHFFVPLLILPIPEDYIDDIDDILGIRLAEEHLEEPLGHRLLEFFGF